MILFLTSSPCTNDVPAGVNLPCVLDRSNGFVRRLRRVFPQGGNLLIIASDPEAFEGNDEMTKTFWDVLHPRAGRGGAGHPRRFWSSRRCPQRPRGPRR